MKIKTNLEPKLTQALVFLRGKYALWQFCIPYFSCVVPMEFAAQEFSLVEEIPESERIDWSLQELFQRDISWKRIHEELVKYLRNESRPQFFNALTVALLPREGNAFAPHYIEHHPIPLINEDGLERGIQVGGIQIQPFESSDAGRIRWDKDEVIAIAVDGQHRLAAIKQLASVVRPDKLRESSVPVIFLIPDSRLGYLEPPRPADAQPTLVSALRTIFIDINKNARDISASRKILLDDEDVACVCLRSLIATRLSEEEEPQRLPLAIVDWQSEINKIDSGPFITTILLLQELVRNCLEIRAISEIEEEEDQKIKSWLTDRFMPSEEELDDLMSQVRRCFNQDVPLTFLPEDLAVLRTRFETVWRPYLFRLFHELTPYRDVWDFVRQSGLHKPQAVNLYGAEHFLEEEYGADRAVRIQNAIKAADPDWNTERCYTTPLRKLDDEIKKDKWAFAAVFQRALGLSYLELLHQASDFVPGEVPPLELREKFTTKWIEAVNALLHSPLAHISASFGRPKDKFWAGIGLKAEETIDFTAAGRNRLQKWITCWVCIYWMDGPIPSFNALASDDRPLAVMISNALSKKQITKSFDALARAREPGASEDERQSLMEKYLKSRFEHMKQQKP